jgi:hypothetical protein
MVNRYKVNRLKRLMAEARERSTANGPKQAPSIGERGGKASASFLEGIFHLGFSSLTG